MRQAVKNLLKPWTTRQAPSAVEHYSGPRSNVPQTMLSPYSELVPYPNLILCGAPRSGTSSLLYYIQEHPEIKFIQAPDLDKAGRRQYGHPLIDPFAVHRRESQLEFHRIASRRAGKRGKVVGLALRYALYMPHIAFNIAETVKDPKILFILRNPVNRTYSSYTQPEPEKRERTFEESIKVAQEDIDAARQFDQRNTWLEIHLADRPSGLLERSAYFPHIIRFFRLFPRESIHIVQFEKFVSDPQTELTRVTDFLGLEPFTFKRVNERKGQSRNASEMAPETREFLSLYFQEFNQKLFALLGWPEDTWT